MLIREFVIATRLEEQKIPVRRSHVGNEAYLDQMVIANSLQTNVSFKNISECLFSL